jgi:large subunit ribosomal protein L17
MRHGKKLKKLGRKSEHRDSMIANLVCDLIRHGRIRTTVAKAKAARPVAEKMVTLGKRGSLHNRRVAIARLQQVEMVKRLFEVVAPLNASRAGGYCRIIKLGPRLSDAAPMAFLEWVDKPAVENPDVIVDPDAVKAEKKAEEKVAKTEKKTKPKAAKSTEEKES